MPTLMGVVNSAIDSVFGEHNEPITKVRVGSLILDGLSICQEPGFIGQIVCSEIRASAEGSRNLETQEDQSVRFSLFNYVSRKYKSRIDEESLIYNKIAENENHSKLRHIRSPARREAVARGW